MRTRLLALLASATVAACSSSGSNGSAPYSPGPTPPQAACEVTGCGAGKYCDTATHLCKTGCVTSAECSVTGQTCGTDHVCRCASSQHVCGNACVASSSVETCGTRCTPCPEPTAGGSAYCGGWLGTLTCQIACDDVNAKVCGNECVSCPGASTFECGATPGTCVATSCLAGFHRSGNGCVEWHIEPVAIDTTTMPITSDTWSALAVDPAGVPEITWACYGVYHERRGATGWTHTKLANDGSRPLIAIDGAGTSQVLYTGYLPTQTLRSDLVYAREGAAGFAPSGVTTIATGITGANGLGSLAYALALDATGVPHVAYWDGTAGKLRHGVRNTNGSWSLDDVGTSEAGAVALAMDGSGRVHVAYQDYTAKTLVYTFKDPAGTWSTPETVDMAGGVGAGSTIEPSVSLAVDSSGRPRIAYVQAPYSQYGRQVYVAQQTSTGWTYAPATADTVEMDEKVSIAVDSHGFTHLGFDSYGDIEYLAPYSSTSWQLYVVSAGGNVAGHVGFVLDTNDGPHLSWSQYRSSQEAIWYAW